MKNKRIFKALALLLVCTLTVGFCSFSAGASEGTRGDMDRNGTVNTDDAIYLLRHALASWDYPIFQSGDVNADKEVNSNDAIYLLRHVLMPESYPLLECGHSIEAREAKEASCKENGNIAYWFCSLCYKCFLDEKGDTETAIADTVIPACHTGGTEIRNAKEPTAAEDGYTGDTCCLGCGEILAYGTAIPGSPSVYVSDISSEGDTVRAVISISNNPGIASLKFDLVYDSILSIRSVEFSGAFGAYATSPEPYINPQTFNWINPTGDVTANGEFVTVTFSVAEGTAEGTEAELRIIKDDTNIFDSGMNRVEFNAVGATVTVNR